MSDKRRKIKASDLYRFELVTYAEMSPDGRYVVYAQQRVDKKTQKKYANLWLAPVEGGKPRQFTFGDHVDSLPRWSPDGQTLAFISNRRDAKQPQIFLMPFAGGEARPLTDLKGDFKAFAWAPDGARLAVEFRLRDKAVLEREADPQKKELGLVARHITRVHYSFDGEGFFPEERWHVWTVDAVTGKAKQLTQDARYDEHDPTWSPDGKWLVFRSNRAADPDLDPDAIDLFVISAEGGDLRLLPAPVGDKSLPSVSPDGQWIAYYATEGRGDWWKNPNLWVLPFTGDAPARNLTAAHDAAFSTFALNDMGGLAQMPPVWARDGQTLYAQICQHGNITLHAVAVSDGALAPVVAMPGGVGAFSFDAAQARLAYIFATFEDPLQVWVKDLGADAEASPARALTKINRALLRKLQLGALEEVWFEGADGNQLQGWILKPPDFDPKRAYPSILEIHGGPLAMYGNLFMHEFQYLAAGGYVVYFSNPRGGLGYGEAHAKAIWGGWGDRDYADLMAWTDYMTAQPYIDPARMGVTGGSYGGYMTVWIIGHTERFKAAVTQRCVSNLISMWGSSDNNWVFQMPFGDQPPYMSIEHLWDCSPMKYIGAAKTPTLVIHSEKDLRCPIEQGQQVFVALKTLHVPTEFVVFPEESHGLSRIGRTDRRIERLRSIRGWFDRYL